MEVVREVPEAFWNMGQSPYIIIIMLICIVVVEFFLSYTKYGRLLYMVGLQSGRSKAFWYKSRSLHYFILSL